MNTRLTKRIETALSIVAAGALVSLVATAAPAHAHDSAPKSKPFIDNFSTVTQGDTSAPTAGPEAGDQNPYGVAVVPRSVGKLIQGNILVSNFNNVGNLQGTGTSIVQYSPDVQTQTTFAEIDASTLPGACPGGVGLTTALAVLRTGWVIVGSLPTTDGTIGTVGAGCLIVLDANGKPVETFSGGVVNGPWDMAASDGEFISQLFFTNVLNGNVATAPADTPVNEGTVVRMTLFTPPQGFGKPFILETKIIGSGFPEENDSAALIIGPTGVALGSGDTLFVADSVSNRIAAISNASFRHSSAGTGQTVSAGGALMTPLGLTLAPTGDILTVNGGDGNIVETTPQGTQVATALIAPAGGGALFGLAVMPGAGGIYFVDDSENQLNLFH
jgi:hypothetical protein